MAREGAPDAGQLDRPLGRHADPLGARHQIGAQGFKELEIYTTRPDTLFGASFLAIAPDHPLAKARAEKNKDLAAFCDECRRLGTSVADLETAEKRGFDTGIRAVHPLDKDWMVPVYVANFVLMDYGTGAIFGCPSGDQRDLDFARKYDLAFMPVILPAGRRSRDVRDQRQGRRRRRHDDQFATSSTA